jgi:hypothetical protein
LQGGVLNEEGGTFVGGRVVSVASKIAAMEPNPHALELAHGDPVTAGNLMFRCGPCDVCGGGCLSTATDGELVEKLLSGQKPVGTFPFRLKREGKEFAAELREHGLATWMGQNRWKMWEVVATLDLVANAAAFTQAFIDERLSYVDIGRLYGYPAHMSAALDKGLAF